MKCATYITVRDVISMYCSILREQQFCLWALWSVLLHVEGLFNLRLRWDFALIYFIETDVALA